ncbi:unnamed protein product, partial [Staurois parvus]
SYFQFLILFLFFSIFCFCSSLLLPSFFFLLILLFFPDTMVLYICLLHCINIVNAGFRGDQI